MALDATQLQTLADDLVANTDPAVIAALAAGNNNALTAWYNQEASPVFWIFKHNVDTDEVRNSLDPDECMSADFTEIARWNFENLMRNGSYDPTLRNNREFLARIFPTSMPTTRAAALADATEHASNAEKLFAIEAFGPGGGDGSGQANSAEAVVFGDISRDDIRGAVSLIP